MAKRVLGAHPETGHASSRSRVPATGPYVTEVLPEGYKAKPKDRVALLVDVGRRGSLLEELPRLWLPRVLGVDPNGEEITAQNGRYGPYLRKGRTRA